MMFGYRTPTKGKIPTNRENSGSSTDLSREEEGRNKRRMSGERYGPKRSLSPKGRKYYHNQIMFELPTEEEIEEMIFEDKETKDAYLAQREILKHVKSSRNLKKEICNDIFLSTANLHKMTIEAIQKYKEKEKQIEKIGTEQNKQIYNQNEEGEGNDIRKIQQMMQETLSHIESVKEKIDEELKKLTETQIKQKDKQCELISSMMRLTASFTQAFADQEKQDEIIMERIAENGKEIEHLKRAIQENQQKQNQEMNKTLDKNNKIIERLENKIQLSQTKQSDESMKIVQKYNKEIEEIKRTIQENQKKQKEETAKILDKNNKIMEKLDKIMELNQEKQNEESIKMIEKNGKEVENLKTIIQENQEIQKIEINKITQQNNQVLEKLEMKIEQSKEKHSDDILRNLAENNKKLEEFKQLVAANTDIQKDRSYASVVAEPGKKKYLEKTALHSVIVSSNNELETGEEILNLVRKTINAKESGIEIENVRKARDRKIIIGCRTEEGRTKVKEKLKGAEGKLKVEDAVNKKPLIIIKNILDSNKDDEIKEALLKQNRNIIEDLREEDKNIEILFRKKTRNPQKIHAVARVTPPLWRKITEEGHLHIDMQRVRVEDHSPLIQCTMCLGYGHTKKLCKENITKCSHCGGEHTRTKCSEWINNTTPKCCNCAKEKLIKINHNAFDSQCPIRQKWESLARATIAYS